MPDLATRHQPIHHSYRIATTVSKIFAPPGGLRSQGIRRVTQLFHGSSFTRPSGDGDGRGADLDAHTLQPRIGGWAVTHNQTSGTAGRREPQEK